jgi:phage internal scaffolding protein
VRSSDGHRFFTRWKPAPAKGLTCTDPSLAKQSFAREADINNIMHRYRLTGILEQGTRQPMWGDFASVPEYQEAQNIIIRANQAFQGLDARLRERFHNDPANLLAFVQNADNRDEAIRLGLVNPASPEASQGPSKGLPGTGALSPEAPPPPNASSSTPKAG